MTHSDESEHGPKRTWSRDVHLTVGQIMYLLAATEPQLDWGRSRRAAVRAKFLAALHPDERQGIKP